MYGRDVESIIRDLTEIGVAIVRSEHTVRHRESAEERVEERLLDMLIPRNPQNFMVQFNAPGMIQPQPEPTAEDVRPSVRSCGRARSNSIRWRSTWTMTLTARRWPPPSRRSPATRWDETCRN